MKIIILITIILMVTLFQNDIFCKVTKYKKNDNIELFKSVKNVDGYVYTFLSFPACQGCIQNLDSFIKIIKSNGNYDFKIFISGASQDYIELFQKEQNWNAEVIVDKIGAYHNFYKILKTNSIIILTNNSKFVDGFSFSEDISINKLENTLKNIKIGQKLTPILIKKEIQFKKDNIPLTKAEGIIGLYSDMKNCYYFSQISEGILYKADTNGIIIKEFNFKNQLNLSRFSLLNQSWRIKDSILVFQGFNSGYSGFENIIFEFNLQNDSIYKINIATPYLKEFLEVYGNPINNGYIACRNFDNENTQNPNLLIFYDKNGDSIATSYNIDELYTKYNLKPTFRQYLGFNKNSIFNIPLFTNKINIFNEKSIYLKELNLPKVKNIRQTQEGLPDIKSKSDWVGFSNRNTYYQYIKINPTNNNILLGYFNYVVPEGITDLESPSVKKEWHYDLFSEKGEILGEYSINESSPWIAYYDKNKFSYLNCTNNIVSVIWVELPE